MDIFVGQTQWYLKTWWWSCYFFFIFCFSSKMVAMSNLAMYSYWMFSAIWEVLLVHPEYFGITFLAKKKKQMGYHFIFFLFFLQIESLLETIAYNHHLEFGNRFHSTWGCKHFFFFFCQNISEPCIWSKIRSSLYHLLYPTGFLLYQRFVCVCVCFFFLLFLCFGGQLYTFTLSKWRSFEMTKWESTVTVGVVSVCRWLMYIRCCLTFNDMQLSYCFNVRVS